MNLTLTDDQRMIRDSAAEFLADASSSSALRRAIKNGGDAELWRKIGGELGWCGTAIAEVHGGLGMGPMELVLIVEQMGRHLAHVPFFSTVCLAGTLLAEAGNAKARRAWLPKVAAGSTVATAVAADAGKVAAKAAPTAVPTFRVSGSKLTGRAIVSDGAEANLLLFIVGRRIHAVERGAKGLSAKPLHNWDGTRRMAEVTLKNVAAERVDDPKSANGMVRARALARLYLAAEQLGGAQQCLDLIVRYTSERRQFGRSIASFQAVKHRCAQLMVMVEGLRSLVYGAAAGNPDPAALALECDAAKALASETYFHAASEAIQLHGGVGFTVEFDPQLYFKRAQAGSHSLGASDALRENIAQALLQ